MHGSLQPNLIQDKLQTKQQEHTHPPVVQESKPQASFIFCSVFTDFNPRPGSQSPDSPGASHSPSFWIQSDGPRLVQLLPEQNLPQRPVQLRHLDPIGLRVCPVKFTP